MIYKYIRFSSAKQDEQSQDSIINDYCNRTGVRIDETIKDEAISGASELSKRELSNLLNKLSEGDTLIISELSRLTRKGTIELNDIIGNYFKPAKVRLIICNYNLTIDCANIDAISEMMLNTMSTFARIERDSLIMRTKAGLQVAKDDIAKNGFHVSKSGNVIHSLGRQSAPDRACTEAAARKRTEDREEWYKSSPLIAQIQLMLSKGYSASEIIEMCGDLYEKFPDMYCCRGGGKLTRSLFYRAKHWILTGEIPY